MAGLDDYYYVVPCQSGQSRTVISDVTDDVLDFYFGTYMLDLDNGLLYM